MIQFECCFLYEKIGILLLFGQIITSILKNYHLKEVLETSEIIQKVNIKEYSFVVWHLELKF
jgi:hypothetical protein